jgi:thiamine pyrophosphokinase
MSSHHVVREKQEPALLVLGLNNFTDELLGQLLEWSPTVVVTADTAEQLNARGIKIDVVINPDDATLQSDIKTVAAQGSNAAKAAIKFLIDAGYPAVNVVTDEFLVDNFLPFISNINIVIYHNAQKIYAIYSGFSKWKPAGEVIGIVSTAANLQTTGLNKTTNERYITAKDGFFALQFEERFLLIAESIM